MSALPQPRPESPRKPAARARKLKDLGKCAARTLPEIQADYRNRTNYARGTGYFPMFHALTEDLKRLSSGETCTWLVIFVFQELSIRGGGPAELPIDAEMSVAELALRIGCDERSVNRVLEYLELRKMATIARLADSRFVIELRYREWAKIEPSYKEWDEARRLEQAESAQDELNTEEDATPVIKSGIVPITTKPRVVRAGHRERSLPITSGTKSFRFDWNTPGLDLRYSAVIDSGEVVVSACIAESKAAESKRSAKRAESTTSKHSTGHGCPNGVKIPPNGGTRKTTSVETAHPRAAELSGLFDALILKWCGKTLSGDSEMLLAACEAIAGANHDYLVKCAIDRAERRISGPRAVVAICKEIAANWEKVKGMPAEQRNAGPKTGYDARNEIVLKNLKKLNEMRRRKNGTA